MGGGWLVWPTKKRGEGMGRDWLTFSPSFPCLHPLLFSLVRFRSFPCPGANSGLTFSFDEESCAYECLQGAKVGSGGRGVAVVMVTVVAVKAAVLTAAVLMVVTWWWWKRRWRW